MTIWSLSIIGGALVAFIMLMWTDDSEHLCKVWFTILLIKILLGVAIVNIFYKNGDKL